LSFRSLSIAPAHYCRRHMLSSANSLPLTAPLSTLSSPCSGPITARVLRRQKLISVLTSIAPSPEIYFTEGNGGERPFVSQILEPGQTGVMDRGYQCHQAFDQWQQEGKHFVSRIKANTKKLAWWPSLSQKAELFFMTPKFCLGKPWSTRLNSPCGLSVTGWAARCIGLPPTASTSKPNNCPDLQTSLGDRKILRMVEAPPPGLPPDLQKQARSHGSDSFRLITYLLLAIYCHEQHGEKVSIKRVRELRYQISMKHGR